MIRQLISLLLFFLTVSAFGDSAQSSLERILILLHGDPVEVPATPQFCGDPAPKSTDVEEEIKWRVDSVGSCSVEYVPNVPGVFTPLSHGGEISQFFFDDVKYESLVKELENLENALEETSLDVLRLIDIQTTLWELISVLEWRRDLKISWQPNVDQKKVDRLQTAANRVLENTLFSTKQIDKLNASELNLSGFKSKKLESGCYLEVANPGRIHESMSQGRLYGRIFVGSENPEVCEQLNTITKSSNRIILSRLPERIPDINAILVLYFNVLNKNYEVVPTDFIAEWREILYSGTISLNDHVLKKFDSFEISFLDYQKLVLDAEDKNRYRVVDPQSVSRLTLLNVNPVYAPKEDVSIVSTAKASCFSCHGNRLKTFDYRTTGGSKSETHQFNQPLSISKFQLRDIAFLEKIRNSFIEWRKRYLGD